MEKQKSRRNFLKMAGLAAAASQMPLAGWSAGFKTLLGEGLDPSGEFSLLKLNKLLAGYEFPFVEQFSTSEFHSGYKMYNLYGDNTVFAGEFHLKSGVKGKNREFGFLNWRFADNGIKNREKKFKYIVSGDVKCRSGLAFSPEEWVVTSRIALNESDLAYGGTGLISRGKVKKGEINIRYSVENLKKTYHSEVLCWKWGLPSVVQNMAESNNKELGFSMLNEFDAINENQKLVFRKKVPLDCGNNRPVEFKVFELTGQGVIPTVYWVDQWNRTVFVVSGMEAFVLER